MNRILLALSCLFLMVGCGAHAPRPVSPPVHIQHFAGEQIVTFWGMNGAWLPNGDVELCNSAHEAVFGLIKLKAADLGTRLLSGYAWGGKIVRRDADGTTYVLVKYEADVEVPADQPADKIAFNLTSR